MGFEGGARDGEVRVWDGVGDKETGDKETGYEEVGDEEVGNEEVGEEASLPLREVEVDRKT